MADAGEVKLFGFWASPNSCRVKIALKLKGVEFEYIEEDLCNKSPLLLKYNPVHKKVPVLAHNGKPIAETTVILEYIDETWKGNPILPKDPYERAMARFWANFVEEKFLPTFRKAVSGPKTEREKAMDEACEQLKTLENELKDKKFFWGEAGFLGYWVGIFQEALGIEVMTRQKFPIIFKWIDDFLNSRIINENLPPRDKLFAYYKARFEAK